MGKGGKVGEKVEKFGNVGEKGRKCENKKKNVEKVGIVGEMEGKGRNHSDHSAKCLTNVYVHSLLDSHLCEQP